MNSKQQWLNLAGRYRRAFNFAWVLHAARYGFVALASLLGLLILIERSWALEWFGIQSPWLVLVPLLAVLPGYFTVRRNFIDVAQALVAIEHKLVLHNALSCANLGLSDWPEFRMTTRKLWQWRLWPSLLCLLLSSGMVYAALRIPRHHDELPASISEMPLAWQKAGSNIEQIRQSGVVDNSSLQNYEQKLSALQSLPSQQWYDHSSMEAGDNLEQQQQLQLQQLHAGLQKTGKSLQSLLEDPNTQNRQDLQQAIDELQQMGLKPNAELLDKLKQLPNEQLDLNKEQLEELQQALAENADKLKPLMDAMKQHAQARPAEAADPDGQPQAGQGEDPQQQPVPPNGGLQMQPGHSDSPPDNRPQNSAPPTDPIKPTTQKLLTPPDLRRASLGDLLETSSHLPETAPTPAGGSAGAQMQQGSDTRHQKQSTLHPDEQQALRRFFSK